MGYFTGMKKLLLTTVFLFMPSMAWAQCNGIFPANTLCGNLSGSPAPPAAFSATGTVIGPASSTSGAIVTWGNNGGTLLTSGAVVAPNLVAVGPKSGTNSIATFRTLIASDVLIAAGTTSGAIQASNGTSLFVDSSLAVSPCTSCTGNFLQLARIGLAGGAGIAFGDFLSPGSLALGGHSFIGCFACQVSTSSAGSTIFAGFDGSVTPVIGNPAGAGGFHMAALGSSVICEGDEAVCVGHSATVLPNSGGIAIGSSAQSNNGVAVGQNATDTSSGGQNILLGPNLSTVGSTGNSILISTGAVSCTVTSLSIVIGIGRSACPSVSNHAVIGGPLLTDFYAGTETVAAAGHFSTIITNPPLTKTANYNPNLGDVSIIVSCASLCQLGLGNVQTSGYTLKIKTVTTNGVSAFASNITQLNGTTSSSTIVAGGTAGKWVDMTYDGFAWQIMEGN